MSNKLNEIAKQIKGMLLCGYSWEQMLPGFRQAWGSVVTDWDDMRKRVDAL